MKKPLLIILILIIGLMSIAPGRVHAAPAAQATNLLQKPGFEPPASSGAAQSWQRWHRNTPRQNDE